MISFIGRVAISLYSGLKWVLMNFKLLLVTFLAQNSSLDQGGEILNFYRKFLIFIIKVFFFEFSLKKIIHRTSVPFLHEGIH